MQALQYESMDDDASTAAAAEQDAEELDVESEGALDQATTPATPELGSQSLGGFLVKRALLNPKLGNALFWFLMVECKDKDPKVWGGWGEGGVVGGVRFTVLFCVCVSTPTEEPHLHDDVERICGWAGEWHGRAAGAEAHVPPAARLSRWPAQPGQGHQGHARLSAKEGWILAPPSPPPSPSPSLTAPLFVGVGVDSKTAGHPRRKPGPVLF